MKVGVAIWDLDNTLVDRNRVYQQAQMKMLDIVAYRLKDRGISIDPEKDFWKQRDMDAELVKLHATPMYDYKELPLALYYHYVHDMDQESAARHVYNAFEDGKLMEGMDISTEAHLAYETGLKQIPKVFEGAKDVLEFSQNHLVNMLFTEGTMEVQKKIINHHGLEPYFDVIYCGTKSSVDDFEDAKDRGIDILLSGYGHVKDPKVLVIGDRIPKDIGFGNIIGAITFWVRCALPGLNYDIFHKSPSTPETTPDYIADSMRELYEQIKTEIER